MTAKKEKRWKLDRVKVKRSYGYQYLLCAVSESESQIYTDCTGADAQGQCTVYYLRKLWSMSVDSRCSGVIFRENPRRLRFLMTTGLILFGLGFFTGMVNYLVLLWDGHSIRDAVFSVITSVLLPAMFIHTTYIGRLEYAEDLKYEDIGDDKDKDV